MMISIGVVLFAGMGLGWVFNKCKLPPLLGMIIAGICIGPYAMNLLDNDMVVAAPAIRQFALVVVLTRAGLSLRFSDVKAVGRPAFLLSFLPACFELVAITVLGVVLFEMRAIDAGLMGCVLAAVSPAVIVPRMIHIMQEKWGTNKKIPQLILAGASLDDIFVIVLFTTILQIAQGEAGNFLLFLRIPISIILGALAGVACAKCILFVVKKGLQHPFAQVVLLLVTSYVLLYIQDLLTGVISISALIGIMVMGMIIKKENEEASVVLLKWYTSIWKVAEIFLFVLVGICVDISYVETAGLLGVVLIVLALVVRMSGVFVSLLKTSLTHKEKVFCMGAYTPKATVQAAIGAIPLSVGLASGQLILTFAVLSILISAPLGSIFIDKTYRQLLTKE